MIGRAFAMTAVGGALLAGIAQAHPRTIRHGVQLQGRHGARQVFTVEVHTPGWLTASYQSQYGPGLALILNGPGNRGGYDRQDGRGPLRVRHFVSGADLAAGCTWQVTVASFGRRYCNARGVLEITYPEAVQRMRPAPAKRDTRTFEVDKNIAQGAFRTKVLNCNVPGRVVLSWQPRRGGDERIEVRVRQKHRAGYIASRVGRGAFDLSFRVTPEMIAQENTFEIEVVNRTGYLRKIQGKLRANKPVR